MKLTVVIILICLILWVILIFSIGEHRRIEFNNMIYKRHTKNKKRRKFITIQLSHLLNSSALKKPFHSSNKCHCVKFPIEYMDIKHLDTFKNLG